MLALTIDTIGKETKIGITSGKKTVDSIFWDSDRNQSEELLGRIDSILKKNKINKSDLGTIYVNTSPGSYTGSRVGVTTANFIALGLNILVLGIGGVDKKMSAGMRFCGPVLLEYKSAPFITKPKSRLR